MCSNEHRASIGPGICCGEVPAQLPGYRVASIVKKVLSAAQLPVTCAGCTVSSNWPGAMPSGTQFFYIVTITEGLFHTVGLKKDGTVIATGVCDDGECDVDDWNNQIY